MTIEIMDFPIKNGDFPVRYVSLPGRVPLNYGLQGMVEVLNHGMEWVCFCFSHASSLARLKQQQLGVDRKTGGKWICSYYGIRLSWNSNKHWRVMWFLDIFWTINEDSNNMQQL